MAIASNQNSFVDPHDLLPPPVDDHIDPYVQRWVAGTNGNLYIPLINRLKRYPIPDWPGAPAGRSPSLLLDIGCGWGRWIISAGRAGYCPVGVDVKLDALQAARRVLATHNLRGYVVAADLQSLPFKDSTFDYAFSYSVIQHTHRRRALNCLRDAHRVLKDNGTCLMEFPIRHGLTNWRHRRQPDEDDFDSWCVRYYG